MSFEKNASSLLPSTAVNHWQITRGFNALKARPYLPFPPVSNFSFHCLTTLISSHGVSAHLGITWVICPSWFYQRPYIRETVHSALNLWCLSGYPLSQLLGGAAVSSHCYQLGLTAAPPSSWDMAGYPLHRENRENGPTISLSGKTQGIWKFCQNTGNFICSSCKISDSKVKRYFCICRENFPIFVETG